jgi:hypothetical protein
MIRKLAAVGAAAQGALDLLCGPDLGGLWRRGDACLIHGVQDTLVLGVLDNAAIAKARHSAIELALPGEIIPRSTPHGLQDQQQRNAVAIGIQ